MVLLAITTAGLKEALALSQSHGVPIWCSSAAISEQDFAALKQSCLTRFNYSLSFTEPETIAEAVSTIEEHHPGQRVWIESSGEL